MKDWRGKGFLKKALPPPNLLQTSPFPSQRLSAGGEADQHEFLPDNSFWESNMAESLIFSPYFLK